MHQTVTLEQAQQVALPLFETVRWLFLPDDDRVADLPVGQLRVCGLLSAHSGPQAMSALSRELGVTLSAMTQIADRLERAGLVRRVTEGSDRRVRCLQLTERAERMMRQREEVRARRMTAALERLSPQARQEVLAALRTLADACAAANGQAVCAAADDQ